MIVKLLSMILLLHSVLQIVKDATPADYNNEELYMEMGKVYFAVCVCVFVCVCVCVRKHVCMWVSIY